MSKDKRFRKHYQPPIGHRPAGLKSIGDVLGTTFTSPVLDAVKLHQSVPQPEPAPEPVRNVDGAIALALAIPPPTAVVTPALEIKFEILPTHECGLYYVTENGLRVIIYSIIAGGLTPIHGAYEDVERQWQLYRWRKDGTPFAENSNTGRLQFNVSMTIVGIWFGRLAWPETGMPGWANTIAKDASGAWYWYEGDDIENKGAAGGWGPPAGALGEWGPIPARFAPEWSGPWQKSLIRRPATAT